MTVCKESTPTKKYLQFNDLVFDSVDMVQDAKEKTTTKVESTDYSFGHGSFVNFQRPQLWLEEKSLSMTIHVAMGKFERTQRKWVKDFVKMNLIRPGKLWAIEGDRILWTTAYITDYSEPYEMYRGSLSFDIDMKLPEGIWHIADRYKTYMIPYTPCIAMDCYGFRDEPDCDCCTSCSEPDGNICCDCCDDLSIDSSLCENYSRASLLSCGSSMRMVYDCQAAERNFFERNLGKKVCKTDICDTAIAGQFYSGTVLDTDIIGITLRGHFVQPVIEINGQKVSIEGEYDGYLRLDEEFNLWFSPNECCKWTELDTELITFADYGFTVHQGNNKVFVDGACCESACVYVKADEITY